MENSDVQKVIDFLRNQASFAEVFRLTSFVGFRQLPDDGSIKEVSIQILDAGSNVDFPRYQIAVEDEDGRMAHGEPANDIQTLLANVHWFHLNEPPTEETEEESLGGQVEIQD